MNLILEGLDVLGGHLEVVLELLNLIIWLLLGGEEDQGNLDGLRLGRVDHGRVALSANLEGIGVTRGDEGNYLAAPAELWLR